MTLQHRTSTMIITGLSLFMLSITLPNSYEDNALPDTLFVQLDPSWRDPQLQISVEPSDNGWALHLQTVDWIFSDLCGRERINISQGHAHIYINDETVGTATLPVYYIPKLPAENDTVTASLRGSDHRIVVASNGVISAKTVLNVSDAKI